MGQLTNTAERFGSVTRALHWIMAAAIFGMLGLGNYISGMDVNLGNLWLFGLHKSIGLTVFGLALLRLGWHAVSPPPAPLGGVPDWQDRAARWTHQSLYALILAIPLAGWAGSSATGIDTVLYGRWTVPRITPVSETWEEFFLGAHAILTKLLLALILLHLAGAITRRDGTLRRMILGDAGPR